MNKTGWKGKLISMIAFILKVYPYLAWAGTGLILLGVIISIVPFRDRDGERYLMRNHFISELGEKGVSKAAWGFNTGMFLSGWLFLPLMIALGIKLASILGWVGTAFGIIAGVAASMVGVYSMDRLTLHRRTAMIFFHSGLSCILFYTIAIFAQPSGRLAIPMVINVIGILSIACFFFFLITVYTKPAADEQPHYMADPNHFSGRPRFWRTAILEWCVFFTIQAWFLAAAIFTIKV